MDFFLYMHEVLNFGASELIGLIMESAKFFIIGTRLIFTDYADYKKYI
jgi:hypothetical protein